MPPLPFVPGVAKMVITAQNEDATSENIMHFQYTGSPPNATQLTDYINFLETDIKQIFIHNGVASLGVTSVELTDLSSDIGATATVTMSSAGTLTGDVLPASAAALTSMEISRRYRGGHPRQYWMLGSASTLAGSSLKDWQPSFIANVGADVNGLVTDSSATVGGITWIGACNVSYVSGGARRVTAVVDHITSVVPRPRVCTMRRRLGKVGG